MTVRLALEDEQASNFAPYLGQQSLESTDQNVPSNGSRDALGFAGGRRFELVEQTGFYPGDAYDSSTLKSGTRAGLSLENLPETGRSFRHLADTRRTPALTHHRATMEVKRKPSLGVDSQKC